MSLERLDWANTYNLVYHMRMGDIIPVQIVPTDLCALDIERVQRKPSDIARLQ